MKWLLLLVGGGVGTVARYGLSATIHKLFGSGFPYGTLVVNLIGCFLIGFLASIAGSKWTLGPEAKLLLIVGFCGAFTTFSTFIFQSAELMKTGETLKVFINVSASVMVGFIVFRAGVFLGEII